MADVPRDVLAQGVEGQVAHRDLLARRPVEVVGQSACEDGDVGDLRRHEQLEGRAELLAAAQQADRIGLLVGHRADHVDAAWQLRELDHLGVPGKGSEEGQPESYRARPHGYRDSREQHRDRARLDLEHRDHRLGSHDGPGLLEHEIRRRLPRQHLPSYRHQQQPVRDGSDQRELLPAQPHGENGRDDGSAQDTATEGRQQPERGREPRAQQRGEPPSGSSRCAGACAHARSRGAGTCASRSSMISSGVVPP